MKRIILLIRLSVELDSTYAYYARKINDDRSFQAVLVQSAEEAFDYVAKNGGEIVAVVTSLSGPHGPELGTLETGNSFFTGAAIVKYLRKSCPKAMYLLFGATEKSTEVIAEFSGKTADIFRLRPESDMEAVFLLAEIKKANIYSAFD